MPVCFLYYDEKRMKLQHEKLYDVMSEKEREKGETESERKRERGRQRETERY